MPSSESFFRFQKNYETFMQQDKEGKQDNKKSPPARSIASPKYMTKLSPVHSFVVKSDELQKRAIINLNTQA